MANVTVNYAKIIKENYGDAMVATPFYPKVKDEYPFDVVRYPSAPTDKELGYRAGIPFLPITVSELATRGLDIIHSHCPCVSTILAREVRFYADIPVVLTYHTKFDVEIDKMTASDMLRRISVAALVDNISACDEVWTVSEGAGKDLQRLGYQGDYVVMQNGVDFTRGRADEAQIEALRRQHNCGDKTVFLFVGRMMWYKGVRMSLDGLAAAKAQGADFKFILVGDGSDREEIEQYANSLGLAENTVFTGAIRDRELLRAYFSMADLFLFPSDFDTNGIVVREAAACGCPGLLLENSCAAEGITDGVNGIIIPRDSAAIAKYVKAACDDPASMRRIGETACKQIYISWDDAVKAAVERYHVVIENYATKPRRSRPKFDRSFTVEQLFRPKN